MEHKIEMHGPKESLPKRKKVFTTLNNEEVKALWASENAEQVAKEFDRIFLKLLRLIKYSTDKNNKEKSELEEQTNNLIKKFTNYLKDKALNKKIDYEQEAFFQDLCNFINFFVDDDYLSTVQNGIPRTSLQQYNQKSFGNQLFQNMYARKWGKEGMCEGGSCTHWTLLLYNFFNKLKEAGLDLDISFFRFKNLNDNFNGYNSSRHAGLMIDFQGKDYMVDHDGIIYDLAQSIVRPLNPYIDMAKKNNDEEYLKFFENFSHENRKETDKVIFFDNVDDFIKHCEKYPEYLSVKFYVKSEGKEKVDRVDMTFLQKYICIIINGEMRYYYLKDNNLKMNKFFKSLNEKIFVKSNGKDVKIITDEDRAELKKYFDLIKNKVNVSKIYDNFTSGGGRKMGLCEFNGNYKIFMEEIEK